MDKTLEAPKKRGRPKGWKKPKTPFVNPLESAVWQKSALELSKGSEINEKASKLGYNAPFPSNHGNMPKTGQEGLETHPSAAGNGSGPTLATQDGPEVLPGIWEKRAIGEGCVVFVSFDTKSQFYTNPKLKSQRFVQIRLKDGTFSIERWCDLKPESAAAVTTFAGRITWIPKR